MRRKSVKSMKTFANSHTIDYESDDSWPFCLYSEKRNKVIPLINKNATSSLEFFVRKISHDFRVVSHKFLMNTITPNEQTEIITILRDPVCRFKSALTMLSKQTGISHDDLIKSLDFRTDPHLAPQTEFLLFVENDKWYNFDKQNKNINNSNKWLWLSEDPEENVISDLMHYLNMYLSKTTVKLNTNKNKKYCDLNDAQMDLAQHVYEMDFSLIRSVTYLNKSGKHNDRVN